MNITVGFSQQLQNLARLISVIAIIIGVAGMLGWILDIPVFLSIFPLLEPIQFNAAAAISLLGLSLLLSVSESSKFAEKLIAGIAAVGALEIGAIGLSEYVFDVDLRLEHLFFRSLASRPDADQIFLISPAVSISIIFISCALLFLNSKQSWSDRLCQFFVLITGAVSTLSFFCYIYGVDPTFVVAKLTRMSMHAIIALVLLCLGVFLARPDRGVINIVRSRSTSGMTLRRILPYTILIPLILGSLCLAGQQAGYYDSTFGVALFSVLYAIIFMDILLWNAVVIYDMERKLSQQKADLEKANLELDSFVYTASHDLRAPLRGIMSFASFLDEDYAKNLDDQGKDYIRRICKGTGRMTELIDDLLALSKISRIRNPYEDVNVYDLLQAVRERIEFDLEKLNVELKIPQGIPTVYCDRIKMTEVFLNLINNAIKFSSKNNPAHPIVEIGYNDSGDTHTFSVKDNGIGIDPQYHDQIFGIFKRLHTEKEYDGTGAGLSIVQRVVTEHQGRVWVESQLGEGAKFLFTIPKKDVLINVKRKEA